MAAKDRHGRTPLHYAARGGHSGTLDVLIDEGGLELVLVLDCNDKLARDLALAGGHDFVARRLDDMVAEAQSSDSEADSETLLAFSRPSSPLAGRRRGREGDSDSEDEGDPDWQSAALMGGAFVWRGLSVLSWASPSCGALCRRCRRRCRRRRLRRRRVASPSLPRTANRPPPQPKTRSSCGAWSNGHRISWRR